MLSKNQNQFSRVCSKENYSSLQEQIASPFYPALYQLTKKNMQVVEREVSCFQEQEPYVRTCQYHFPQHKLENLSPEIYSHIHLAAKGLFSTKYLQQFLQAGCLMIFYKNWKKLTSYPSILDRRKGKSQSPFRNSFLSTFQWALYKSILVDQEIKIMLKKVNKNCSTRSDSFSQLNICGSYKEIRASPSYKLEGPQLIHSWKGYSFWKKH